ncbi:MAG: class I SAM-dependent methyltransferase [Dehalococcoidia bacterium]
MSHQRTERISGATVLHPSQHLTDRTSGDPVTVDAPLFVFLWRRFSATAMAHGQGEHRRQLLDGLAGRVIEVGAGEGLNFAYYPPTVTEVIAVEPENRLRASATTRARTAPVPIRVIPGVADRLPADDAAFDAAVASLVLCSVPDQARALVELGRVLRPGGELRFYEHVAADRQPLAGVQHLADPLWSRLGGGCHLTRRSEAAIREAGFTIERIERFAFRPNLLGTLGSPHILGTARRET